MLFEKRMKNLLLSAGFALLAVFLVNPIYAQNKDDMPTKVMVSETGIEYEVTGWDTRTIYDPMSYTYNYWETPIYSTVKTKDVYPVKVSEFDSPPVFKETCASASEPMACTNEKLQEFISNQRFEYPVGAQRSYQEGLEYVTFTLNEKGHFEGTPSVLKKDDPCRGCSEKAIEIIKETDGMWQPAILDGEPVKVILTVPVRFALAETPVK
ncbi:MAG: energy transducer TonB [Saprospiraceae bacterium]|nr:energy transducer TonB [Saprospiraceae bacterium]